jgi:hypothetical protein
MKKLLSHVAISTFGLGSNLTMGTTLPISAALPTLTALAITSSFSTAAPAAAQNKVIPPRQWWFRPEYSPDGTKLAVQTPPPKISEVKTPDGKVYKGQTDVPRKTVILSAKDFSLIAEIDSELWPTWSPDSKYICANGLDRKNPGLDLAVYDASNGAKLRSINALPPEAYAWSPDSKRLFLTQRKAVSILDLTKKQETLLPAKENESYFQNPQWSPDGKLIAASLSIENDGEQKSAIRIWDANTREKIADINLKAGTGRLAWSPDGKLFIYSEPLAITVLDADSMKVIKSIETNETRAGRFVWSNDKTSFSYQDAGVVHILDAATMKETTHIAGPTNGFFNFDWSADDKFILISAQSTASICDAKNGKYYGYKTWEGAERQIISPDQKLLVIQNLNDLTESEPISLPPVQGTSPFKDGKTGSPGWDNNATPKTIEECFAQFDKELSAASRERFKKSTEQEIGSYGGGSFITDSMMADIYGKWSFTELSKYFEKRGISDQRDITDIILNSYWRYLNNKPIELDDQISSHKAWWDNQRPVISSNQELPDDLLNCKLKNKAGEVYTIGELKAKWKVVCFVDTDGYMSAEQLKCLKELRENHPGKDLAIIVCVVPPESLTKEHWPAIQTKVMGHGDEPAKDMANFKSNCGDIIVSAAPLELTQALIKFVKPTKYSQFGLPQTLVISEPKLLKLRVNHFDETSTLKLLEKTIKE